MYKKLYSIYVKKSTVVKYICICICNWKLLNKRFSVYFVIAENSIVLRTALSYSSPLVIDGMIYYYSADLVMWDKWLVLLHVEIEKEEKNSLRLFEWISSDGFLSKILRIEG